MKIIKNYNNIEFCYLIDSGKQGKTAIIFSGIHGNEKSGILATEKFLEKIKSEEIKINSGKIIIVSKANIEAIKENKREIKQNLNRLFRDDIKGETSEEKRALDLMQLLKKGEYLLDLHSTSGPSIPFLFAENKVIDFAKKLGVSHIVGGWGELSNGVISGDTENYMNNLGGFGLTFESGNHDNPNGEKNAYQMILNFLGVLGIIDKKYFKSIGENQNIFTKIKGVYIAKTDNFKYLINAENFTKIKSKEIIGLDGKEKIIAKKDMILILPKEEKIIKAGIEAFFEAEEI